jgi:hypothetical protein
MLRKTRRSYNSPVAITPPPSHVTQAVDFRLAINGIPGLAWSTHLVGTVEFVNQRWCDYTFGNPSWRSPNHCKVKCASSALPLIPGRR